MKHGQLLKTDVDFENAIMFQLVVSITQDGKNRGSGQILSQSHHYLEIAGAYYFKAGCEFMVMSMAID